MLWKRFRARPTPVPNQPVARRPARKSCRPALETLEERCVPATVSWTLNAPGFFDDPTAWTDRCARPSISSVSRAGRHDLRAGRRATG